MYYNRVGIKSDTLIRCLWDK